MSKGSDHFRITKAYGASPYWCPKCGLGPSACTCLNMGYPENPPEDLICKCGRHLPCRHCPAENEDSDALSCQEYLSRPWEPTPEEKRLRELAAQYHDETESHDRTICTGPIRNGAIMPRGSWEHSQINKNAIAVRKRLGTEVAALGFTEKDWQHAIANHRQNVKARG